MMKEIQKMDQHDKDTDDIKYNEEIQQQIKELNKKLLEKTKEVDSTYEEHNKKRNELVEMQNKKQKIEQRITEIEKLQMQNENELKNIEIEIQKYKDGEEKKEENIKWEKEEEKYKIQIEEENSKKTEKEEARVRERIKKEKLREERKKRKERKETKEKKMDEREIIKKIEGMSRGIPNMIIKNTIPEIEEKTNAILAMFVDFTIGIEYNTKGVEITIKSNSKHSRKTYCGSERFVISTAIRLALTEITQQSRPNFMIIDEGISSLDAEKRSNIRELLEYLSGRFDFVMIMTHIDSIKSEVDEVLEIRRRGRNSYINNTGVKEKKKLKYKVV